MGMLIVADERDIARMLSPARAAATPVDVRTLPIMGARMSAYEPTLRDRIGNVVYDAARAAGMTTIANQMRKEARTAVDFLPILGDAVGVDEAAQAFGAGDYGAGMAGLGLAALGAVPVVGDMAAKAGKGLLMDQASRIAREKDMGFRIDMPLYHGSSKDFPEFDPAKRGATTGAAPAQQGAAWLSRDPETANEFAVLAGKAHPGSSPQVYPLVHRASKPAVVDLTGDEKNLEIAGALEDAFANGYDSVMFRNYTTPGGATGKNIVVVRDPEQLRSVFARFDPAKSDSKDLLAALTGIGAVGVVGEGLDAEQLAQREKENVDG